MRKKMSKVPEELLMPKQFRLEVQRLMDKLAAQRASAEKCTTTFGGAGGGGSFGPGKIEYTVPEILETEQLLAEAEQKYRDAIAGAEQMIGLAEKPEVRDVLKRRYLDFQKFEVIADKTAYDASWVFVLHQRGIETIRRKTESR